MAFNTNQDSYRDFRSIVAERSDSIVAWIGAGLSASAGLPTWSALRSELAASLQRFAAQLPTEEERVSHEASAEQALISSDLWSAIALLKGRLPQEEYKSVIRRLLSPGDTASIPPAYKALWKLRLSGVINLNLDRLCVRSFNEVRQGLPLHVFTGIKASDFVHVLRSRNPWVAQLHGELDDVGSWILTPSELRRLIDLDGYQHVVNTCCTSRTIVFMGVQADDLAAGGPLSALVQKNLQLGSHFWITHRFDSTTRDWADKSGVRIIHYHSDGVDHSELNELLDDLLSFVSSDDIPVPVRPHTSASATQRLPTPSTLEAKSAEEIRQVLNSKARDLLGNTTAREIEAFERFSKEYSQAIYRAWYVSTTPPDNTILDFTIVEEVKTNGAFGTVYRAQGKDGKSYAIKILHERIRRNREMLHSFRRGVRSMELLTDAGVGGVVKYYGASEIPAMVVMDFVEGDDLNAAVAKGTLKKWGSLLRVCCEIVDVIRASHRLPQRVLHRDIRPSNIMLENCWGPLPDWDNVRIVVLDFDLSWHVDAFDVSVTTPGTANGYLAPEQAERSSKVSTRSAAVDSYGLGMTFYYMRSAMQPRFAEHRYATWEKALDECAYKYPCHTWKSLPKRFSRLIFNATREQQVDRWDTAQIQAELMRLRDAEGGAENVRSAELWAEEVAAQISMDLYTWDDESNRAQWKAGGLSVVVSGDETERSVSASFRWQKSGLEHHQDVRKWIGAAKERIRSLCSNSVWSQQTHIDTGRIECDATISVDDLRRGRGKVFDTLSSVYQSLTFR